MPELSLSQPPANQPSETGVVGQIQCQRQCQQLVTV